MSTVSKFSFASEASDSIFSSRDDGDLSSTALFKNADIKEYKFDIHNVFTDKIMYNAFESHLRGELNTEPLEFVMQIHQLEKNFIQIIKALQEVKDFEKEPIYHTSPCLRKAYHRLKPLLPSDWQPPSSPTRLRDALTRARSKAGGLFMDKSILAKRNDQAASDKMEMTLMDLLTKEDLGGPTDVAADLEATLIGSKKNKRLIDIITSTYKQQISLAISIMKTFIDQGSPKEVNLSSLDKKTYSNLFKDSKQYETLDVWVLPLPPHELFKSAKVSIVAGLEQDSFPRFIRSQAWFQIVKTNGMSYLNKIGKLIETVHFPYTDADFKEHMVFDRDIFFLESLIKDDYKWELVGSSVEDAMNVYKIEGRQFFPNVSFYKKMQVSKWTGTLNYSFDVSSSVIRSG